MPTHLVKVNADLQGSDYGALGFLVGKEVGDGVPRFRLRSIPRRDELKALGAALAASGSVALYYVDGATPAPPAPGADEVAYESINIEKEEIEAVYSEHSGSDADIVALGCPHCSREELERIADLLDGQKVAKEMWIYTARKIRDGCPDLVERIESSGARVFCDTCMVVSPATEGYRKMMVNSGKALVYLPGLGGVDAAFGSLDECVDVALGRNRS